MPSSTYDTLPDDAARVREHARIDALALLDSRPLTAEQARALFKLLTIDVTDAGTVTHTRYGIGLIGHTANQLVLQIDTLNDWLDQLMNVSLGAEAFEVAEQLWERADLKWAGRLLPSAVLHTRDPQQFVPWTSDMTKTLSQVLDTDLSGPRTAAAYRRFSEAALNWAQQQSFAAILIDRHIYHAATLLEPKHAPAAATDDAVVIPDDAFAFLRGLSENNAVAWFREHKHRYQNAVRDPLIALVTRVGATFVEPVLNDQAEPQDVLETRPDSKHTVSKILRNSFGKGDQYWTFLWAAFFRETHAKKHDAAQLFMAIHSTHFECGYYVSPKPLQLQLRQRLEDPQLRALVFDSLRPHLDKLSFGAATHDSETTVIREPADLLTWVSTASEDGLSVRTLFPRGHAALSDGSLPTEVAETFRAVYTLLLLTTPLRPLEALQRYIDPTDLDDDDDDTGAGTVREAYTVAHLADEAGISLDEARDMVNSSIYQPGDPDRKGQMVLYGPPGTGKTWLAKRVSWAILGERPPADDTRIRQVQFHPAYGYEDFVEGLRPVLNPDVDGLRFRLVDGVLRRIVRAALRRPKDHFVLLVDEMNRADLPRVFGELMFLMSQRESQVTLPVSENQFRLPPNLTLIGTMNTADRSISHIDAALRRRFRFFEVAPSRDVIHRHVDTLGLDAAFGNRVLALFDMVNERLERDLDTGRTLGHAWFLRTTLDQRVLEGLWTREVLPLIEDYFDGDPERVRAYRLEALLNDVEQTLDAETSL